MTRTKEYIANLVAVYEKVGVPLDRLPYTKEMGELTTLLRIRERRNVTCREVWRDLVAVRKSGGLPRIGRMTKV